MERRRTRRNEQRLSCELLIGDRRHPGTVLDLSRTGLFVETAAAPPPGERVRVMLRLAGGGELELEAIIARRCAVPVRLGAALPGGVGLRIESASDDYLQLLGSTMEAD
jgi:hypothetical protein